MALATVGDGGLPNVRMVLLKEIEPAAFVFYTNYESVKAREIDAVGDRRLRHALEEPAPADPGARDRDARGRAAGGRLLSLAQPGEPPRRLGLGAVAAAREPGRADARGGEGRGARGIDPPRPPFWGGFRLVPLEIEFWADGAHRLHDRFRWSRPEPAAPWEVVRLSP